MIEQIPRQIFDASVQWAMRAEKRLDVADMSKATERMLPSEARSALNLRDRNQEVSVCDAIPLPNESMAKSVQRSAKRA